MPSSILIAGLGNIFHGDDAFGVAVIHRLAGMKFPSGVKVMDIGIRSMDLGFALLDDYDLVILVDATSRGSAPGTLYTIEIQPEDIPDVCDQSVVVSSHSLDPVWALALAKSMGATFKRALLIGCEPLVLTHDDSGHIGLSEPVEAAVDRAVETIRELVQDLPQSEAVRAEQEVYFNDRA